MRRRSYAWLHANMLYNYSLHQFMLCETTLQFVKDYKHLGFLLLSDDTCDNPRTDGGLGHLTTDGGRITAPPPRCKRSKLETSGKRHWIRADKLCCFYWAHLLGQVKMTSRGSKKSKWRLLRTRKLFANNLWTNRARAKLTAPSGSSRWYASKYTYHDLIRSKSRGDLRSRDLNVTSRSKCISFDAAWWAEYNETMHGDVTLFYAKLLANTFWWPLMTSHDLTAVT